MGTCYVGRGGASATPSGFSVSGRGGASAPPAGSAYRHAIVLFACVLLSSVALHAQGPDGYVSVQGDLLPNVEREDASGRRVSELRARVLFDQRVDVSPHLRLTASAFAEGLVADRVSGTTSRAAVLRPQELHADVIWPKADVRVGYTRIVWGRLDEFLPTDVVNPQDISRFFFEGRTEGRMPVGLTRVRWLPNDRYTLEGIVVPVFRAGRFDQLEEGTSPFNLEPSAVCAGPGASVCTPIVIARHEPARTLTHAQGGGRFSATSGRLDWSVSAYRGFEPLPVYVSATNEAPGQGPVGLDARFPRYTMVGGDVETVRGVWGLRGEVAFFPDRTLQAANTPAIAEGRAVEAGAGVDRKAGEYRISGNVVLTRQWAQESVEGVTRTDVTFVAVADRSFARETRRLRVLGVYDPSDGTAFVRAIAEASLRDNVSLEASAGVFAGEGLGRLGRLASRDFVYLRLKVFY